MRQFLSPVLALVFALGSGAYATPAVAADIDSRLDAAIQAATPAIVELRHRIHQNPELGYQETATAKLVAEHLRALGLEVQTGVAVTGVVALLKGGKPGPVVAVRADMDALPVTETSDLPFKSTKRSTYLDQEVGVAHACGHDIHTSVLLGVASALTAVRADLPGTVKFIFQPAEEGPPPGDITGALKMLRAGVLENPRPQAILGMHSFPDLDNGAVASVGLVGWGSGPAYAAVDQFAVTIKGKQSHGAQPHLGVDPIVTAAQAVLALQTIRSRTLSPLEPSVVTVGIFRGGERFNIIPAEVRLEGTVRTYSEQARATIERRMREILDGITEAAGATYEISYLQNAPATINEPALSERSRASLERTLGKDKVVVVQPTMGGEDFAYFANEVPGFYFRLGVVAPGTKSGGLHTPDFRADDSAIPVGMRAMAHLVVDTLEGGSGPPRP